MTGTPNVNIDRLTLRAGSMSESEARRLAELVAIALGRLAKPSQWVDAARLSIDLPAPPGRGVAETADAVAAAIVAALTVDGAR